MSERAAWVSGAECERHFLAYCADCLDLAGLQRDANGEVTYQNDCAARNLISATGGVVHAGREDITDMRPQCRNGACSGLGVTGRKRSTYRATAKPVTCKKCLERNES